MSRRRRPRTVIASTRPEVFSNDSGPVRAEQRHDLALVDLEVDAEQHLPPS
jgi:hypothetical protein